MGDRKVSSPNVMKFLDPWKCPVLMSWCSGILESVQSLCHEVLWYPKVSSPDVIKFWDPWQCLVLISWCSGTNESVQSWCYDFLGSLKVLSPDIMMFWDPPFIFRQCIGFNLMKTEAKVMFCHLIRNCRCTCVQGLLEVDLWTEQENGLLVLVEF